MKKTLMIDVICSLGDCWELPATSFSLLSQEMAESPPLFRVSIRVQLDDTQTGEIVIEVLHEAMGTSGRRTLSTIDRGQIIGPRPLFSRLARLRYPIWHCGRSILEQRVALW
jgi:hypothetical protein